MLASVLMTGCYTTGAFYKEANASEEHAILKFQPEKGVAGSALGLQSVLPISINELPPSHRKWSFQKFLVNPGSVEVRVKILGKRRLMAICNLALAAEPNRVYTVGAEHEVDLMRAIAVRDDAVEVARCEGNNQLEPMSGLFFPTAQ
jgi:hypothetical protein